MIDPKESPANEPDLDFEIDDDRCTSRTRIVRRCVEEAITLGFTPGQVNITRRNDGVRIARMRFSFNETKMSGVLIFWEDEVGNYAFSIRFL